MPATNLPSGVRTATGDLRSWLRTTPPYVPFMLLVTGAYLTIEVPFSAHLLDVMGGDPTTADIDSIEHFGRLLTGLAVAIAVVGHMLSKRVDKPFGHSLLVALFFGALSVAGTFHALNQVAEYIGRHSSGEDRRDAYRTMLARRALIEGMGVLPGLPERTTVVGTPEWKAFVSVAPAMGVYQGSLLGYVGADTEKLVSIAAERQFGDVTAFRERFFGGPFQTVRDAYASYDIGMADYREAQERLGRDCMREFSDYMRQRERRGYGLGEARRGNVIRAIRKQVRDGGVPVASDWNVDDPVGFCRAYVGKGEKEIRRSFEASVSYSLGKGRTLPPGLSWDEFVRTDAVQQKLREEMGTRGGAVIREQMSASEFDGTVRRPLITKAKSDMLDVLLAAPETFERGASNEKVGEEAAKAVFVPSMAITLSIAGAALHLFKFSYLLMALVGRLFGQRIIAAVRMPVAAAVTASAGLWLAGPASALTLSEGYASVRSLSKDSIGAHAATVLTVAIDMQARFYPMGHSLGNAGPFRWVRPHLPPGRHPATSFEATTPVAIDGQAPGGGGVPIPTPRPEIS